MSIEASSVPSASLAHFPSGLVFIISVKKERKKDSYSSFELFLVICSAFLSIYQSDSQFYGFKGLFACFDLGPFWSQLSFTLLYVFFFVVLKNFFWAKQLCVQAPCVLGEDVGLCLSFREAKLTHLKVSPTQQQCPKIHIVLSQIHPSHPKKERINLSAKQWVNRSFKNSHKL